MIVGDTSPDAGLRRAIAEIVKDASDQANALGVYCVDDSRHLRRSSRPVTNCGIIFGTVVLVLNPHIYEISVLSGPIGSTFGCNSAQSPSVGVTPVLQQPGEEGLTTAKITVEAAASDPQFLG